MRHRLNNVKLNRNKGQRKALLFNLIESMLLTGSIKTTIQKAKYAKPELEKMVTRGKNPSVANRRILLKDLRKKSLVDQLLTNVSPVFASRPGGYTRIEKIGKRLGDNALVVKFSFVDNILKPKDQEPKVKNAVVEKVSKPKKEVKKVTNEVDKAIKKKGK